MNAIASALPNRTFIVDGSGYIFRAFYAVPPLSAPDGLPTNALFGFSRMLLKLLVAAAGAPVIVVFDAGRETFRTALYPEYKATRGACPEDLVPQLPYFREIVAALGLCALDAKGFEADDIIGTLVNDLDSQPAVHEIVVVTADKDLSQLVSPTVRMWDTMRDVWLGEAEVEAKFGVVPSAIPEMLALVGDTSDNIPGVPGVGPKTAAALVKKFGTVAELLGRTGELREAKEIRGREKFADFIEANGAQVQLARKLVELDSAVPYESITVALPNHESISLELEGLPRLLERRAPVWKSVTNLGERLGFAEFKKDVERMAGAMAAPNICAAALADASILVTVMAADFPSWVEELRAQPQFAFDIESTSLDVATAQIVGVAFAWSDSTGFYVPLAHRDETGLLAGQVEFSTFVALVGPILADKGVIIKGQNLKYDSAVCATNGIKLGGLLFDTMIAAYLIRPDGRRYSLDVLSGQYLGIVDLGSFVEVTAGLADFSYVSIPAATTYAARDAITAWRLADVLQPKLEELGLTKVFSEIEMPLVPLLGELERRGILIDVPYLAKLSEEFGLKLEVLHRQVCELAGREFNLNSPKQLSQVLFDELGLSTKGLKRTKGGVVSTDASVLERLASQHPLPALLAEYRALQKLKGTYVDTLPTQVSSITGRLHTRLHQTTTGTGRLSSSDPNLQNIPIQTKDGARVRGAFIAAAGMVLIAADYSQIELRVLAHLSNDPLLVQAFLEDRDIHEQTAREILGKGVAAEVAPEERRIGKTINFGVVYGMSAFRLARDLGISVSSAAAYIDAYFRRYAGVKRYFDEVVAVAEESGVVKTMWGRRRVLNEIDATSRDKGFLARVAMNAPVQGTAADIIKLAMVHVEQRFYDSRLPVKMLLQIHDELLFECDATAAAQVVPEIKSVMENVIPLAVPLRTEVVVGTNWRDMA